MPLRTLPVSFFVIATASACQSPFVESNSLISGTTVLAIQADPAEGAPGASVQFEALVVSGEGDISTAIIDWALCNHPRSVAENNSVAPECFSSETALIPVGRFPSLEPARTEIPSNACALFGSEPAPAAPGQAPTRPADPDATGGYYAPVRASVFEPMDSAAQEPPRAPVAIGQVRVRCALPSAPVEIARDYAARYTNNQNPVLEELRLMDSEGSETSTYVEGEELQLEASWPPDSAEDFVLYDAQLQELIEVREELKVSWFVTAGVLASGRTIAEDGAALVRVKWTAPKEPQEVQLWAVLRDNRGGMSWKRFALMAD